MTTPGLSRAVWRKSSRSNGSGQCVEVAEVDTGTIAVRDSKNPTGSALCFGTAQWQAFLACAKAGEFDTL